ncbi:MAG TPA: hypothetical protein VGS07_16130 [Thermoanaerobaculia bacterium]|nr:hypothetical protein [Thermoanaerobaculia bacterium]
MRRTLEGESLGLKTAQGDQGVPSTASEPEAQLRFEVGWTGFFAAQLGDVFRETQAGETGSESGTESCLGAPLLLDCVAEDLADFFFRTVAMPACAPLNLELHIILEVADQ